MKEKFVFVANSLSMWARLNFKAENIIFNSLQQYVEYNKALLFNDEKTAEEILKASQPRFQQDLGKKVRGFKKDIWEQTAENIIYEGINYKAKDIKSFRKLLLSLSDKELIYRNDDPIFGEGKDGKGKNLLGKCYERYIQENLINKE